METPNKNKSNKEKVLKTKDVIIVNPSTTNSSIPTDLIDDLKKNKIDPLTEGSTNLGYEERAPRKKELEQDEHYDQDDK